MEIMTVADTNDNNHFSESLNDSLVQSSTCTKFSTLICLRTPYMMFA